MVDKQYSNREIDLMFKEIKNQLDRIEKQTSKTNGRVSTLETWKSTIHGALIAMNVMLVPIAVATIVRLIGKFI